MHFISACVNHVYLYLYGSWFRNSFSPSLSFSLSYISCFAIIRSKDNLAKHVGSRDTYCKERGIKIKITSLLYILFYSISILFFSLAVSPLRIIVSKNKLIQRCGIKISREIHQESRRIVSLR